MAKFLLAMAGGMAPGTFVFVYSGEASPGWGIRAALFGLDAPAIAANLCSRRRITVRRVRQTESEVGSRSGVVGFVRVTRAAKGTTMWGKHARGARLRAESIPWNLIRPVPAEESVDTGREIGSAAAPRTRARRLLFGEPRREGGGSSPCGVSRYTS
jgi:hypothetical protein